MLNKYGKLMLSVLMSGFLLFSATASQAAQATNDSFAETKVVLQISDPNPFKQTLVLNVASNLKRIYGPDNVDVEIVAFGPGLRLLMDGNVNEKRIQGLADYGVKFSACEVTLGKMTDVIGKKPVLNKNSVVVKGGIIRIIELMDKGYKLVKP